jgi:Protein of unknown function (DUF3433)
MIERPAGRSMLIRYVAGGERYVNPPIQTVEHFISRRRRWMLSFGVTFLVAGVGLACWAWWFMMSARAQSLRAFEDMAAIVQPTSQQAVETIALSGQSVQFWSGFNLGCALGLGLNIAFLGLVLLTTWSRDARLLKLLAADRPAT